MVEQPSDEDAAAAREHRVALDVAVGLLCARSAEAIVGMLAILKAGGAYVPLDPEDPRLGMLVEEARLSLIVGLRSAAERIGFSGRLVDLVVPATDDTDDEDVRSGTGATDLYAQDVDGVMNIEPVAVEDQVLSPGPTPPAPRRDAEESGSS